MLAATSEHLCQCSVVLKAKAPKLPPTMAALWELQDWTTEQIAKSWERAMGSAVESTRTRSLTSEAAVKAELKRLDAVARAFGRSPGLHKLIKEQNRMSFALGAIYIQERDAEIRRTMKLPPTGEGFRVDQEPRMVTKAKKSPAATITAGFNFNMASEQALSAIDDTSLLWFRDIDGLGYSSPAARAAIMKTAQQQIASGASGFAVATTLANSAESLYGVGKFAGKGLTYWGGVSENAATVAAVRGELMEMASFGWDRFEIVNPMDERTTPICQMLNGKTVMVPHAMEAMKKLDGATTIEEVKSIKPWASGGKATAVTSAVGPLKAGEQNFTAAQSQALANAGFAVPPYHFRCRSFIDIAYMDGDGGIPTQIGEVGPTGTPLKVPPGVTGPEAAAAAALRQPPSPLPKPPTPEVAPGQFPFNLDECRVSPMELGGANPKFVIEGPDGSLWMFKDYSALNATYRANVDELAAMVGNAAGLATPETYTLTLPRNWSGWGAHGQRARSSTGSVSRLYSRDEVAAFDIGGGVRGSRLESLANPAIVDVQTDHAINWLISNGDAHYENFIMLRNGRVAGIDKGQGFKFFGRDRLAVDYVSPQAPIPSTNGFAYAESQLVRYQRGEMGRDFRLAGVFDEAGDLTEFGARLKAMQDIPDDVYAATIRPYVEAMHSQRRGMFQSEALRGRSVDDALEAIVARKNNLIRDFDELYKGMEGQRRNALGLIDDAPKALTPEAEMLQRRNLWKNPEEVFDAVSANRMSGSTVFVGGSAVEDMTLHGMRYAMRGPGQRGFQWQFKGRLRPDASSTMTTRLEQLRSGQSGVRVGMAKTDAELIQEASDRINAMWAGKNGEAGVERFIRSFNARHTPGASMYGQAMGKYDQIYDRLVNELEEVARLRTAAMRRNAEKRLGYRPTAAETKTAERYLELLRPYKRPDGAWNADNIAENIGMTQPVRPKSIRLGRRDKPKPAPMPETDEFKLAVQRVDDAIPIDALRREGAEELILEEAWGTAAQRSWARNKRYDVGELSNTTYVVSPANNPNVKIRFTPHTASSHEYKGDFRIVFNRNTPTASDLADARRMLDELGTPLSVNGASVDEMKVMWARKQARVAGLELDSSTSRYFANIPDDLPYEEQLKRLEVAFNKAAQATGQNRLRWNSLTDGMDDLDFMPVFREASDGVSGVPQWIRRDLNEEGWAKAGVHGARSNITGDGATEVFRSMAEGNNLAMVSTAQRARNGSNWWSGMSPIEDMNTGGANYVFTRMNTRVNTNDLANRVAAHRGGGSGFNPAVDAFPGQTGIYYKPRTLNYTDNVFYESDLYGRVDSSRFINNNMVKTHDVSDPYNHVRNRMSGGSNEIIFKRSVGFDDVEFWVVENQTQRAAMIQAAEQQGITEIGGKPVADFFLSKQGR